MFEISGQQTPRFLGHLDIGGRIIPRKRIETGEPFQYMNQQDMRIGIIVSRNQRIILWSGQ
ncbi:MAG: hypothetical protein QM764_20925 [Chitinophagaceae bacterium]